MRPHVNIKGGIIGKLLEANLTAEAGLVFGLAERALEVSQHMLLQGAVGGESAAARPHWAFEGCLARVGQPMKVEALLRHATVAAQVTLNLKDKETEQGAGKKQSKETEEERFMKREKVGALEGRRRRYHDVTQAGTLVTPPPSPPRPR